MSYVNIEHYRPLTTDSRGHYKLGRVTSKRPFPYAYWFANAWRNSTGARVATGYEAPVAVPGLTVDILNCEAVTVS